MNKLKIFNSNQLKIFACLTMLLDHIGSILFPQIIIFRIIGRLSFPIFAFLISEGAKYTKNKVRYLLNVGILGIACQILMIIFLKQYQFNILITFAISIIIIYSMDYFKKSLFNKNDIILVKLFALGVFVLVAISPILLAKTFSWFRYSYGFYGCMCAVFASAPNLRNTDAPQWLKKFDIIPVRILSMSIPLVIYSIGNSYQFLSLVSLAVLLFYSEKRGKANLKYLFYVFYPAHLIILHLINFLI